MSYQITDEEKNIVKMNSPFVLPDSPTASGMKPSDIKKFHYQAYLILIEFINLHLNDVNEDIKNANQNIDRRSRINYIGMSDMSFMLITGAYLKGDIILFGNLSNQELSVVMVYDTNNTSDYDILLNTSMLDSYTSWKVGKKYKHSESKVTFLYLGNINVALELEALKTSLETLNVSFIETQNDLDVHKTDNSAHSDIRDLVNVAQVSAKAAQSAADTAQTRADNAYNLARGKAKVHPVANVTDMYTLLQSNMNEINEGDVFIIAEPLIPEFIVYSKDVDVSEGDISISTDSLPEFAAGEKYYIADLRVSLLALESGIDTSKFATKEEMISKADEILVAVNKSLEGKEKELISTFGEMLEPKLNREELTEHNASDEAHPYIKNLIEEKEQLLMARAKNRVYVLQTIGNMYNFLGNKTQAYIGDFIIIVEKGFRVFELCAYNPNSTVLKDISDFSKCEWKDYTYYYIESLQVCLLTNGVAINVNNLQDKLEFAEAIDNEENANKIPTAGVVFEAFETFSQGLFMAFATKEDLNALSNQFSEILTGLHDYAQTLKGGDA